MTTKKQLTLELFILVENLLIEAEAMKKLLDEPGISSSEFRKRTNRFRRAMRNIKLHLDTPRTVDVSGDQGKNEQK